LDIKAPDGKVETWAVEAGAPNALIRRGLRKADVPIGGEIVVEGFRAKDRTLKADGVTVKFTDGRNFFRGSSGTGTPGER
jgi:uncharacterized protein DUF6152